MNEKEIKIYHILRVLLFASAFLGALVLSIRIIFPTQYFDFNFARPDAAKNTLTEARIPGGESIQGGKFKSGETADFDAGALGYFSRARVELYPNEDTPGGITGTLSLKRSFQAFLYPEGDPIGFPDGKILSSNNDLYFVSSGQLRRFASKSLAISMGFQEESFQEVSPEDLEFNPLGDPISANSDYPEGTIFKIDDGYYLLKNNALNKFLSEGAFMSRFNADQAVLSSSEIKEKYPESSEIEGFASGSLLAYGTSAFIVSDGIILPIGDATIFESKGFDWNDLIKIGGDELSFYEKGKLFELDSPHPEGTIFKTKEDPSYFLVSGHRKHLLPTTLIAESWIRKSPVLISRESLNRESECQLKESVSIFGKHKVSCELDAEKFNDLLGTDFEFSLTLDNDNKFDSSRVILEKNKNKENFLSFLGEILGRIKRHYVGE